MFSNEDWASHSCYSPALRKALIDYSVTDLSPRFVRE